MNLWYIWTSFQGPPILDLAHTHSPYLMVSFNWFFFITISLYYYILGWVHLKNNGKNYLWANIPETQIFTEAMIEPMLVYPHNIVGFLLENVSYFNHLRQNFEPE